MRIALISCVSGVSTPPVDYGGIEAEVAYLADAFVARGHDVTVYGTPNPDHEAAFPFTPNSWRTHRLLTEADALTHIDEMRAFDVVHDFSHSKPLRLVKLPKYYATTMWTDNPAGYGRDIFPSDAVRKSFSSLAPGVALWAHGLASGRMIPLGIPVGGMLPTGEFGERKGYACVGRVAPIKGQDIALAIAARHAIGAPEEPFTVAGHVGAYGDRYFAMTVERDCRRGGGIWVPNPPSTILSQLLQESLGLIHTHRWLESFSLVVAEALCRGTPVLTSNVGAPQEWVRATDGGSVADLAELEEYRVGHAEADPLEHALDTFFEVCERPRPSITKRARKMFDINVIAERYEKEVYGW